MRSNSPINTVCFVGNYLPRRCGIATFTTDLCESIAGESPTTNCFVIAMNDRPEGYEYGRRVRYVIAQNEPDDYELAAEYLRIHQIDIVCVQHEYGIYGGPAGVEILRLLERLSMPIVSTLHTVLEDPDPEQRRVLIELCRLSDRVVVMSDQGKEFLISVYGIDPERIVHIPHGIPNVPFIDPAYYKEKFGAQGKRLLLTFGLLSPGKGIEHAVRALPAVVSRYPDVKYIILGATHPNIVIEQGERYREGLVDLANELGVGEYVDFVGEFVSIDELCEYLCASDIFITPYPHEAQITSGTLAYAVGTGNAVVSTPYWYAKELLADGRGRIVGFSDPEALSLEIIDLLEHPIERNAMRKHAYDYSRRMIWPVVAASYLDIFELVRLERQAVANPAGRLSAAAPQVKTPEIRFHHLEVLTDDTGLLQHAMFTIPDRREGYCTDDNARALVVAGRAGELYPDLYSRFHTLATRYLTFVEYAMNEETGRFRNFMTYDRRWLEESGSEDCHARCLAGLGDLIGRCRFSELNALATRIFEHAAPIVESFSSPRSWAFAIIGLRDYLKRYRGDLAARRILEGLAGRLGALFSGPIEAQWPWPEATLTYANAILPHAMLAAGALLGHDALVNRGLAVLEWLSAIQTGEHGVVSLIGNRGWYPKGGRKAIFDQQPIDAHLLLEASAEAYLVTEDERWLEQISRFRGWFLGENDLRLPLYDRETGGCRDGLNPNGVNANEGAESTIAWLQSALVAESLGV